MRPSFLCLSLSAKAVAALLRAETIGDIEPHWDLIENHVSVGVEFRQVLARRRRWAGDFDGSYAAFSRIVLAGIETSSKSCRSCFGDWDRERTERFEVPLVDLLDDPVAVVDQLFMLPYEDDAFRLDLFKQLRELCATNLLVASGFRPDTNIRRLNANYSCRPEEQDRRGIG